MEKVPPYAVYVSSYTGCYKDEAQSIHVKWAWYGVLALGLFCGIVYGLLMLGNTGTD